MNLVNPIVLYSSGNLFHKTNQEQYFYDLNKNNVYLVSCMFVQKTFK